MTSQMQVCNTQAESPSRQIKRLQTVSCLKALWTGDNANSTAALLGLGWLLPTQEMPPESQGIPKLFFPLMRLSASLDISMRV